MDLDNKDLSQLFQLANKVGNKRYHKLTQQDFEDYRKFDQWRYVNGDSECGTTQASRNWVNDHSDHECPICDDRFFDRGGKTIDHKLPRSQYPWLSLNFKNLWVICRFCNEEKGEKHWYEYEHYTFVHYPDRYLSVKAARPIYLLQNLSE